MPADQPPTTDNQGEQADQALAEELRFISEWEDGVRPLPASIVRARQVYRAHPWMIGR